MFRRTCAVAALLVGCSPHRGPDGAPDASQPAKDIATLRDPYYLPGLIAAGDSLHLASNGADVLVSGDMVQAGDVPGRAALWSGHWRSVPNVDAYRVAASADGALYAASPLIICDLCGPAHVVRLDQDTWTQLPDPGIDIQVLFAVPGRVFVAGRYSYGPNILVDDGTGWAALGTTDNTVAAIAEHNGTICIGGDFTRVDGVSASRVACLANGTWTQAGNGLDGSVTSLAFASDGSLVAGGTFDAIGGKNIAILTGNSWSAIGGGTDGEVNAVAIDGDAIVIGGTFQSPFTAIARFENAAWSTIPGALESRDARPTVAAIAAAQDGLYIAGHFDVANGIAAANIFRWSASGVSSLTSPGDSPQGIHGEVRALLPDSSPGTVLAAGRFLTAGTTLVKNVARLTSAGWEALGDPGEPINVLARSPGGDVYSAGDTGTLRRLTGSAWTSVATLDGEVHAMTAFGPDLIVGGDFTGHVQRWTGSTLAPLGSGLLNPVLSLHVFSDGRLCAGVQIASPGENAFWCWNGADWVADGSLSGWGSDLAEQRDGTEIAAGTFLIDEYPASLVVHEGDWKPIGLDTQGDGGSGPTSKLATYGAGAFVANDDYVLWWDGTATEQQPQRLPGRGAHSLLVTPDVLFVGRDISWASSQAWNTGPFEAGIAIYDLQH